MKALRIWLSFWNIRIAAIVRKAVDRFVAIEDDEERQEEFRQLVRSFLRFYAFVAQVVRLDDTSLERLSEYSSWLNRMLPPRGQRTGDDVTEDMLTLTAFAQGVVRFGIPALRRAGAERKWAAAEAAQSE